MPTIQHVFTFDTVILLSFPSKSMFICYSVQAAMCDHLIQEIPETRRPCVTHPRLINFHSQILFVTWRSKSVLVNLQRIGEKIVPVFSCILMVRKLTLIFFKSIKNSLKASDFSSIFHCLRITLRSTRYKRRTCRQSFPPVCECQ